MASSNQVRRFRVDPSWKNTLTDSQTFTGTATNLSGPAGPGYTINDGSADYGTKVGGGATGDCNKAQPVTAT